MVDRGVKFRTSIKRRDWINRHDNYRNSLYRYGTYVNEVSSSIVLHRTSQRLKDFTKNLSRPNESGENENLIYIFIDTFRIVGRKGTDDFDVRGYEKDLG